MDIKYPTSHECTINSLSVGFPCPWRASAARPNKVRCPLTGEKNCHKYAPPPPPTQYPPVQTSSVLHRHSFNTTALPNVLWCRNTTEWDTLLHGLGTPPNGTHCHTASEHHRMGHTATQPRNTTEWDTLLHSLGTPPNGTHCYTASEHHRMGHTATQPRNTTEWDTLLHSLGTPPNGTLLHSLTSSDAGTPPNGTLLHSLTSSDAGTPPNGTLLHSLTSSDAGTPLSGTHCYTADTTQLKLRRTTGK